MFSFQRMPPVTRAILRINIAVFLGTFLLLFFLPQEAWLGLQRNLGLIPQEFVAGKFWQPLTSMFMHGGFIHLAINMLGVWSIGYFLEKSIGSPRYLQLYLVSGLTGALAVIWLQWDTNIPTVGASGALTGLLGAIAVLTPNTRLLVFFFPVRARNAAIGFGVISLLLAVTDSMGGVSHWGHLGGLVGGWLYTTFALSPEETRKRAYNLGGGDAFGQNPGAGGPFGGGPFGGGGPDQQGPAGANPFGGGVFRGGDPRQQEQLLRMLQTMFGNANPANRPGSSQPSSSGDGWSHPTGGDGEKVINPRPGEEPPRSDPRPTQGTDNSDQRRVVYFDPVTGRFYVR